jgi:DNA polymerase V
MNKLKRGSKSSTLTLITPQKKQTTHRINLYHERAQAGFPSPAEDYIDCALDLNEYLIKHPSATFFVRVHGDSMKGAGIFHDDILIVDRALEARDQSVVLAILDGEFTVKRLNIRGTKTYLLPENKHYMPIEITEGNDFQVWGIVTNVIHRL